MLKRVLIGLVVVGLTIPVATGGGKTALDGTWKAVKATENGNDGPDADKHQMTFKGDSFVIDKEGKEFVKGTFKVDADKKPMHIDLKITKSPNSIDEGKTAVGIFKIEGDTLTWCAGKPGTDKRPTEFTSEAGSQRLLVTLQKAKKE